MRHGMTAADPVPRPARVAGVDVARGAALLGMMAAHTLEAFDDEGAPTMASVVAAAVNGDVRPPRRRQPGVHVRR
jgi:uncharacterized membrane protein